MNGQAGEVVIRTEQSCWCGKSAQGLSQHRESGDVQRVELLITDTRAESAAQLLGTIVRLAMKAAERAESQPPKVLGYMDSCRKVVHFNAADLTDLREAGHVDERDPLRGVNRRNPRVADEFADDAVNGTGRK